MANLDFKRINIPHKLVRLGETETETPAPAPAPVAVAAETETPAPAPDPVIPAGASYPSLSTKFLLAGRAVFTVTNPKGDHYTYRVKRADSPNPYNGEMRTTYFVTVKAPGGQYPYAYIGMLNTDKGTVKCTAKSVYLPHTKEYQVAVWACQAVINQKLIPEGYKIDHAGRCGKCGKELTDPVSIERGIGPDCWETLNK
jgi:hypothetical protein